MSRLESGIAEDEGYLPVLDVRDVAHTAWRYPLRATHGVECRPLCLAKPARSLPRERLEQAMRAGTDDRQIMLGRDMELVSIGMGNGGGAQHKVTIGAWSAALACCPSPRPSTRPASTPPPSRARPYTITGTRGRSSVRCSP